MEQVGLHWSFWIIVQVAKVFFDDDKMVLHKYFYLQNFINFSSKVTVL